MRILITGANGFIGQHLFKKLIQIHTVTGVDQNESEVNGQKIHALNLLDQTKVLDFFKDRKFDSFIHLAAKVPRSFIASEAHESLEDNIRMTQNILKSFDKSGAQKFIYASGLSVLGDNIRGCVSEKTPVHPDNDYTRAKYEGEKLVQKFAKNGKNMIIFRISAPYGLGLPPHAVISKFMQNARQDKDLSLYGTGSRSQDFIYVDDLLKAFEAGLNSAVSGVYNIASGQTISMKELAETILTVFPRSKSKIVYGPEVDLQENYRIKVETNKAQKELKFKAEINLFSGLKKMKGKE